MRHTLKELGETTSASHMSRPGQTCEIPGKHIYSLDVYMLHVVVVCLSKYQFLKCTCLIGLSNSVFTP